MFYMAVKNLITGDVFTVKGNLLSDTSCVIQHHLGLLYIHIDNEMWELVNG